METQKQGVLDEKNYLFLIPFLAVRDLRNFRADIMTVVVCKLHGSGCVQTTWPWLCANHVTVCCTHTHTHNGHVRVTGK